MDWILVVQNRVKFGTLVNATMKLLFPLNVLEEREFYWAAEEILASKVGLCSVGLIYLSVKLLFSNPLLCLNRLWPHPPPYLICTGGSFLGGNGGVPEDGRSPQSNIEVMDERKHCRRQGEREVGKIYPGLAVRKGARGPTMSHMFLSF